MEINITKDNYQKYAKGEKTLLLDFYADWCGPCKMLAPVLSKIAKERDDVVIGRVNVDEERELANRFSIMSIPSLFVLKNGNISAHSTGYRSKKAVEEML